MSTTKQVTQDASRRVQRFTIGDAQEWMDWNGFALADVTNEAETPGVKLGAMGFARAARGVTSDFEFPYDEVVVVTKGACSLTTAGQTVTARAGEVLYIAAGVPTAFRAEEDVELVYVASSPYGEHNREFKAEMRKAAGGA